MGYPSAFVESPSGGSATFHHPAGPHLGSDHLRIVDPWMNADMPEWGDEPWMVAVAERYLGRILRDGYVSTVNSDGVIARLDVDRVTDIDFR